MPTLYRMKEESEFRELRLSSKSTFGLQLLMIAIAKGKVDIITLDTECSVGEFQERLRRNSK